MSIETLKAILAAGVAVLLVLLLAVKVGRIAQRRGRNFYEWTLLGIFVPVFAVLIIYMLPDRSGRSPARGGRDVEA